ncbi:galanin receptor type 2 isoform X2 [Aricia agestis]|nr:galanin receptor type 2 isoform X2 [Aricia agestis]
MAALASGGASRLRTPQLLSSCAADLLVCAASAPLAATRAANIHHLPCSVAYYIESFPVAASTLSLVAMAADRCGAVRRGRRTPCARPYLAVTLVWTSALLLGAVTVTATCMSCPPLAAAHAVVTYCMPVVAVTRCHWAVRVKLTALSLTARAAHGELPLPVPLIRRPTHVIIIAGVGRERRDAVDVGDVRAKKLQPSLLGPQPQTSTLRSRRRLGNILVGIAALFGGCWCPHAVIVICAAFGRTAPTILTQYALLLGHAHSAINAAAYWVLNRHALTAACAAWRLPQLRVREERPSSTNEAALGAFHPRLARKAPAPRPPPSSFLY